MVQVIRGKDITLDQLIENFGLQRTDDKQFFWEWQDDLPEIPDGAKQTLEQIKREYIHLSRYPLLEPVVKMVVLSPLLRLAGFYQPPFYIASEKEIEISSDDEGTIVRGKIDILIFQPQFWILVIEAKRTDYSLSPAIPQALAYMLANPEQNKSAFGFITNGSDFMFLKLTKQEKNTYGTSYPFSLWRGDDLQTVVSILKRLGQLVISS